MSVEVRFELGLSIWFFWHGWEALINEERGPWFEVEL